jgi:hypothetical protein
MYPSAAFRLCSLFAHRIYVPALLLLGAVAPTALMAQQCPAGQQLMSTQTPTGVVRVSVVPGSAGGIPSGVMMKPGYRYVMTATGSIRVGVFGETGTPPDGWVPQGPAGNGFPDPDAYTFSLLYRIGSTGVWQMLGSGQSVARLGPHDPAGTQIQFGINDTKLSDNSGFFNIIITEFVTGTKCGVPPPPPTAGVMYGSSSSSHSAPAPQPALPCAGKTSDGRMQGFQFPAVCAGTISRVFPIEACTRADALPQAQAFARADGCILTSN